jgi:hypothetical protein
MFKSFFPMDRVEALTLAFVVSFSAFCFLPVWRSQLIAGMAVFGWLMALLMLLSPALTLLVFRRSDRSEGRSETPER